MNSSFFEQWPNSGKKMPSCEPLALFQPSSMRDHGYDISDYYGVDPRYGSLGDFVEFSHACKQRGIRLIIDLVLNHCSDEHVAPVRGQRSGKQVSRLLHLG